MYIIAAALRSLIKKCESGDRRQMGNWVATCHGGGAAALRRTLNHCAPTHCTVQCTVYIQCTVYTIQYNMQCTMEEPLHCAEHSIIAQCIALPN